MVDKKIRFSITTISLELQEELKTNNYSSIPTEGYIENNKEARKATSYEVYENTDNFLCIAIRKGEGRPLAPEVYNIERNKNEKNRRTEEQIEMNQEMFVMIDVNNDQLYLSDFDMKHKVSKWLSRELNQKVTIKSIIDVDKALDGFKVINEVHFSEHIDPRNNEMFRKDLLHGLINQEEIGGYSEDINNYKLIIKLSHTSNNPKLKERLQKIMKKVRSPRSPYKLQVSGSTDENLERVLNMKEAVDKIPLECSTGKNNFFDVKEVFSKLKDAINR